MNKNMKSHHIRNLLEKHGLSEKNIRIIDPIIEFKQEINLFFFRKVNKSKARRSSCFFI